MATYKPFGRGISDAFVDALNREYEKGSWWNKLVTDKKLFLGIREDSVNLYYAGASILKLSYVEGRLVGETHFKYLLDQTRVDKRRDYVSFSDGVFSSVEIKKSYRRIVDDLEKIKTSAKRPGDEKHGVHNIVIKNENVIDIEIAIPGEKGRMDFAALRNEAGELRLIFYEAKLYGELKVPNILDQVDGYRNILSRRKNEIEESYRRVRANLGALKGLSRRGMEEREFTVNPEVRVVVFGFDDDQRVAANAAPKGKFWLLRNELGAHRVLTKGKTSNFVNGISGG